MINQFINIDTALDMLKKRSTTVDDVCKFIYEDIVAYQMLREDFYFEEFKNEFCYEERPSMEDIAVHHAEVIVRKIEKDVKDFTRLYATNSIDCVLDAINEKRFKTKKSSELLLVVLTSLREFNGEI